MMKSQELEGSELAIAPSDYETTLACIRVSTIAASAKHSREAEPLPWLVAFIASMQALGWVTLAHVREQHLFTPGLGLAPAIYDGRIPEPQPPNTRFKTVVRHVIKHKADGTQPLPPSAQDNTHTTHLVIALAAQPAGLPRVHAVHMAGSPDPEAPKTRLPLALSRWEAEFDPRQLGELSARLAEQLRAHGHAMLDNAT